MSENIGEDFEKAHQAFWVANNKGDVPREELKVLWSDKKAKMNAVRDAVRSNIDAVNGVRAVVTLQSGEEITIGTVGVIVNNVSLQYSTKLNAEVAWGCVALYDVKSVRPEQLKL